MSRIALLTPYAPPVIGGISTFVSGMKRVLVTRGHEVRVIAGSGLGDGRACSDLGQGRTYTENAEEAIKDFRPEVIHCSSHRAVLAAGVRYRRAHSGTRLIFSFHTTPKIRIGLPLRRLLDSTDVVTFVSEVQKEQLRTRLRLKGELRLLRPAVDIEEIDKDAASDWARTQGIQTGFPTLSFIGPLEYPKKVKGVLDLVASLSKVRTKFPSAQLLVVGDGTLRPKVVGAALRGGAPVLITGFIDRPEFVLAATDIYCHISYQEGLPLALLEAMAARCPVIASKSGGIPEVLDGTNGLLVEPGPKAIADAILVLAADATAREKMGRAALATIQAYFSWESRLPDVYAAYGIGG